MKISTPLKFSAVFAAISIGAVIYYWPNQSNEIIKPDLPPVSDAVVKKDAPLVSESTSKVEAPKQHVVKTRAMANEFYASHDLRAFVEKAKTRPEEGGISYAYQAFSKCKTIRQDLEAVPNLPVDTKEDSVSYGKRLEIYNKMKYLCQGFTADELSDDSLVELIKSLLDSTDVISMAESSISKNPQHRQEYYKQIVELQDPILIQRENSTERDKNSKGEKGQWFDGEFYPVSKGKSPYYDSWQLVSCSFGASCDNSNNVITSLCIREGKCYDNLSDFYKYYVYKDDEASFNKLIQLNNQITKAIKQGRTEAFLPQIIRLN